jgi:hypothetical protein
MAGPSFTVTQITYNFTATVTAPFTVALDTTTTNVLVNQTTATISVINNIQPVTITTGGAGSSSFNQNLNTVDNVSFASVTTPAIYGYAGQPVSFPTGIIAENVGTLFTGGLDFGTIFGTYTNILSLLFAAIPIDMGTIVFQPQYSIDMGTI